ncbi:ABC transporter permease [Brevibacterium album]|uniref:ABC transporter permease n=1 Tax=Brevibacterium album TaxID=417948 RepID=UPI00041726A8|nr:ABC transporter permease [Brevibacterium album]
MSVERTFGPGELRTAVSVPSWTLGQVGRRLPLDTYIEQLWRRRHFILAESRSKIAGTAGRNLLGYGWLVLNPLLNGLGFYVIFGLILGTSRGIDNFVGFLMIGVFFFQLTMRCVTGGTQAVRSGRSMIRAFAFPRAALPITVVVREVLNFMPTFAVLAVVLAVLPPAENLTWRVVLVVPCFVLQVLFAQGCAFLLARLGHILPDISNLVNVLARFWLYASGVFFSIDRFDLVPFVQTIMKINPMYSYLEIYRNSILYGVDSPPWMWMLAAGWAFVFVIFGFLFFYRGEETYGRAE